MSEESGDGGLEAPSDEAAGLGAYFTESPTAEDVIGALDLSPHPEGGFFRETYRAEQKVSTIHGKRSASTSALYLVTGMEPSRFHRLRSDELWFYHAGALAELVLLRPLDMPGTPARVSSAGLAEHKVIGPGSPYELVPAGWWVAARAVTGDQSDWGGGRAPERRWTSDRRIGGSADWTLVSCVVTPGFEFEDFEMGKRETLLQEYPLAQESIKSLT